MKKIILSLGVSAALVLGIAATGVEDTTKSFSIGGFEITNPFADTKITNPLPDLDIPGKIAALDIPNPLVNFKMPEVLADVRFGNPLDSSTWWDGADHVNHTPGEKMSFNPMSPKFWMSIPNPKTHSLMHGAIFNPANWSQFLKPETYAGMRDMNELSKWFEAKTYDVLLDPQTYAYWMQPGAYQHLVNIDHYAQLLNGNAYEEIVDTAVNNFGLNFKAPEDKLSPGGWFNSVTKTGDKDPAN